MNQRNVNLTLGLEEMTDNLTRHENVTGLFGASYDPAELGDAANLIDEDVPLDSWLEWLQVAPQRGWLTTKGVDDLIVKAVWHDDDTERNVECITAEKACLV